MIPSRLSPNGAPGSTVFRAYRGHELIAEVTTWTEADVEPSIDTLWTTIEPDAVAGRVVLVVYDGATGWSLPGLDPLAAG